MKREQRHTLNFWNVSTSLSFLVERQGSLDKQAQVELDQLCANYVKREVLRLMAEGYTRKEIASETRLSEAQVEEAIALLKKWMKYDEHEHAVDVEPLRRQIREAKAAAKLKE